MAMDAAFRHFGIDPLENKDNPDDGMTWEVNDRWNKAWDVAKQFYIS